MSGESIQSYKLQGHQGSVSCLDISEIGLLSGSEDRTARLWDLREGKRRACLCIQTEGEVMSVAFEPPRREPPSPLEGMFAKDSSVYLTVDNHVYVYDLRKATAPILRQPTTDLSSILQNQDEINQIGVCYFQQPKARTKRKGSNTTKPNNPPQSALYLAAADDAGTVRIMDTDSSSSQILQHDPNGVVLVPSCAFRPGGKGMELASGGTDCKIHLWDISKPRRPVSSFTITPPQDPQDSSKPQVCNPPYVYSLAWSPSGKLLAAGLGDGNCNVFSIQNRSLVQVGLLSPGHDASVASVLFPSFAENNERVLLSAGNDGAILCWDLGSNVLGDDDDAAASSGDGIFADSILQSNSHMDAVTSKMQDLRLDEPRVMFGLPHGLKPNWMVSQKSPGTLFVADTSNDITAYAIPLR